MRISMQTGDQSLDQLRTEIQQLTAAFERKNGPVKTTDIIVRGQEQSRWNGAAVSKNDSQSQISQQIVQRYATAPCLKEFAKELGITATSLSKRAAAMSIRRYGKVRKATSAEKLDISPRQVRNYRQQIETMQEAA